jgi:hypothetical protein
MVAKVRRERLVQSSQRRQLSADGHKEVVVRENGTIDEGEVAYNEVSFVEDSRYEPMGPNKGHTTAWPVNGATS